MTCELCDTPGGKLLWQDDRLRVVCVDEPGYNGYCRIIWNSHIAEMTDLDSANRAYCMHVVFELESLLRELLRPDKVNLASLGNLTPHLHWHVIARFRDDPHFPQSIWGVRQREVMALPAHAVELRQHLAHGLAARLGKSHTLEIAKHL